MAEPHVITALIKKRREIAGQIEHAATHMRQLVIDLDNLDHTLRLFAPDIDLDQIHPKPLPPRNQAFRGEVTRIILTALRQSDRPLTTKDLAEQVIAERGLNTADKRLVRTMGKRVGATMRSLRNRGLVQSKQGPGQYMLWALARDS